MKLHHPLMHYATHRLWALCLSLLLLPGAVFAQGSEVIVTDDITSDQTWTSENTYVLNGLIFVNDGADLEIEAGTVVKARLASNITSGDAASALIVRRGGQLFAEGNRTQPIIFTTEVDDVTDPSDLTETDRGLWGGLILLGTATTNQGSLTQIEGIPVEDEEAQYGCTGIVDGEGGCDDADNSGVLRYVSIRHGGFSISGQEGDEINGLTMGAVGSGTTIENVEVFANFDDAFEWFGGTVEAKNLVAAFAGDDSFDYDQGFRGKGQFWFSIHADDRAGRGGEHDGGDDAGDGAEPLSKPVITNATYLGAGTNASVAGGDNNDRAFAIRDAAAGLYYNSVFAYYPGVALNIEDLDSGIDSRQRLEDGDLDFVNNVFFGFGQGDTFAEIVDGDFADSIIEAENAIFDPELASICRETSNCLDPRPTASSPILTGATGFADVLADDFFTAVDYHGAFGEDLWVRDWTALSNNGYLGMISSVPTEDPGFGEIPQGLALEQNYPNPFSQATTVAFELDSPQSIELAVYDALGRRVNVLASGNYSADEHTVRFEANDLSAGVYVLRLQTESQVLTRIMTLVR